MLKKVGRWLNFTTTRYSSHLLESHELHEYTCTCPRITLSNCACCFSRTCWSPMLAWRNVSGKKVLTLWHENIQILVEYKTKDPNHVEWAKAIKELYLPGLREYVKSFYPLGPVWSPTGTAVTAAPSKPKAPAPGAPAPPPAPSASLFSSETSQASSSRPKQGMAAVFQEINSGKPVTSGKFCLCWFSIYCYILEMWFGFLVP